MERTSRDQKREETRERVYAAALEVFRRDGVENARIDDIARLAGVSRGTFYFHFPTKDDVLLQLVAEAEERMLADLRLLPADTPVGVILETVARAIADRWRPEPRLFVDVGLATLRRTAFGLESGMREPVRVELAVRFAGAIARDELVSALPADLLADVYLLNLFAASLAWSANPVLPVEGVLSAISVLFLRGAGR